MQLYGMLRVYVAQIHYLLHKMLAPENSNSLVWTLPAKVSMTDVTRDCGTLRRTKCSPMNNMRASRWLSFFELLLCDVGRWFVDKSVCRRNNSRAIVKNVITTPKKNAIGYGSGLYFAFKTGMYFAVPEYTCTVNVSLYSRFVLYIYIYIYAS